MKVRIVYTEDVPDSYRRAMNEFHGKPGLASRKDVQQWYLMYGISMDDDLASIAGELEDAELEADTS